jgi:hypothetical protein
MGRGTWKQCLGVVWESTDSRDGLQSGFGGGDVGCGCKWELDTISVGIGEEGEGRRGELRVSSS